MRKSVLYVGQCYYNFWYLSRELRKLGWRADVLDTDSTEVNQLFYHGSDFNMRRSLMGQLWTYLKAIFAYDVFHFANAEGMHFGAGVRKAFRPFGHASEIRLLKLLGKKIVYSNNGCRDGVLQSSFAKWGPESICATCAWRNRPDVCGDDKNARWGRLRNSLADYQFLLGSNRLDYNIDPKIHEGPWAYPLDKDFWNPDLLIPANFVLPYPKDRVLIYHAVGNFDSRASAGRKTVKSTHIYLDLIEELKREGQPVELIFFRDVPNKQIRYYQAQADIVVDMLNYGWFGANVREAMMLGKPVICYLRPEWLEDIRKEIPDYIDELPIISATPETVKAELLQLIENPAYRADVARRSRAFAEKWHASDVSATRVGQIYESLFERTAA